MSSMENTSILDQIISNHKTEEIAKLNAVEIINSLFDKLNERERDVLTRRFDLRGKGRETLEYIGEVHKLTRERIRQIETASLKKLQQLKNLKDLEERLDSLRKAVTQLLEEHGGFTERDYLLNVLMNFSVDGAKSSEEDRNIHKNHLDFLISKLLYDEFEEVGTKNFKNSVKFKHQSLDHLEKLAEELVEKIKEAKKMFLTAELINLMKELDSFKNNLEKFDTPNNIDISSVIGDLCDKDEADLVNVNKVLYSILQAHKDIEQNKFGRWGIKDWREVNPKTINDKVYLILKNHGQPMHFAEIADKINQIDFDAKRANAATVHNELILDNKYVLVGRGLYGLAEWGYKNGTVSDVIVEILTDVKKPMSRDEIIDRVLEQRLVKKATIILALMNKDRFEKAENGRYKIKEK